MACLVKNIIYKYFLKRCSLLPFFIFHMGKTRMQVKNDLRCLRQKRMKKDEKGFITLGSAHLHFHITSTAYNFIGAFQSGHLLRNSCYYTSPYEDN